jgi:hypothetical protein
VATGIRRDLALALGAVTPFLVDNELGLLAEGHLEDALVPASDH